MRVKSAPGSAAANRSHTDAVTAPIDAGPPPLLDRAQVQLHVLRHQGVGEPGRVATGEHVVRELVARGRAPAARAVQAPRASWPCRAPPTGRTRWPRWWRRAWWPRGSCWPASSPAPARAGRRRGGGGRSDPASTGSTCAHASSAAGVHHRERAGAGARHAAGHRRVDVRDTVGGEQLAERPARRAHRWSRCRPRAWCSGRPPRRISRATCSDAAPSGRLSTTTSARAARPRRRSPRASRPSGARSGPSASCATTA